MCASDRLRAGRDRTAAPFERKETQSFLSMPRMVCGPKGLGAVQFCACQVQVAPLGSVEPAGAADHEQVALVAAADRHENPQGLPRSALDANLTGCLITR
jgi:hypothetical protein